MRQIGLLVAAGIAATCSVATATIIRVPQDYPTIQTGIEAAVNGDTVLVADGVYTGEGNRDIDFGGKAILVTSRHGPETCVIDCEGFSVDPHRGFYFHSGEDSSAVVKGFTITNGYASGSGEQSSGAAVLCVSASSPTIEGNIIIQNRAYNGGAIRCFYGSPAIKGNMITGNKAYNGGGIACHHSSPTIEGNTITRNTAEVAGGGIYCISSSPTIEGNEIMRNTVAWRGGGISCWESSSPTIWGNSIIGNTSHYAGGGIYCWNQSSPVIGGNTITANSANHYGGGISCSFYCQVSVLNTILWEDIGSSGQEIDVDGTSSVEVSYSDIEGGWEGEGNVDADPMFVSSDHRDYRLLWDSPCLDSGHPDSLDPDGTRSDMGSYPFDQSTPLTVYLTPDDTFIVRPSELGVIYTLINIEPDPWTFWLRSDVIMPEEKSYQGTPILGPLKVTLKGGWTVQRYITHRVTGRTQPGTYTYTCQIGLPPDQIIDTDSFSLDISPYRKSKDKEGID